MTGSTVMSTLWFQTFKVVFTYPDGRYENSRAKFITFS